MQIKSELRKNLLSERSVLSPAFCEQAGKAAAKNLFSFPSFLTADLVLCYISVNSELPTREIIEYCFRNGKPVAAPVCTGDDMSFRKITSFDELKTGAFSIPEPDISCSDAVITSDTVCLAPALCYNGKGYRIGYGKGYYDRFFKNFPCKRIGLCYDDFIREFSPDSDDEAVQTIITQKRIISIDP